MAILPILRFPDPRLRTVAKPIAQVDARIQKLADDMLETMYHKQGVGLAATQINVHERLVVTDCAGENEAPDPRVFINPEIIKKSDETKVHQEGCLSIPENYADVERADRVTVAALDRDGKPFELDCDGLLAVCIQHEIDHLNGKLFIDYLSPARRNLVREKMKKYERRLQKEAKAAQQKTAPEDNL